MSLSICLCGHYSSFPLLFFFICFFVCCLPRSLTDSSESDTAVANNLFVRSRSAFELNMNEEKKEGSIIHHSNDLEHANRIPHASERKDETYSQRQEYVTRKQLELQDEIAKRQRQIKVLYTQSKSTAHTRNQKLFLEFLQSLAKQYHDLARLNREVASAEEVDENRVAFKKLIWFDELDKIPDSEEAEIEEEKDPNEGKYDGEGLTAPSQRVTPHVKRLDRYPFHSSTIQRRRRFH